MAEQQLVDQIAGELAGAGGLVDRLDEPLSSAPFGSVTAERRVTG